MDPFFAAYHKVLVLGRMGELERLIGRYVNDVIRAHADVRFSCSRDEDPKSLSSYCDDMFGS
jgi:hypothetical protein